MSRQSQQIANVFEVVIRNCRGRLSATWMAVVVVLVGGYLIAEPTLEARLGVDLPGISTPGPPAQADSPPAAHVDPQERAGTDAAGDEYQSVLSHDGRSDYISPAGLRYTRGSTHGHRLAHLMAHTKNEPDRPGPHGVFDVSAPDDVVRLVDDVYRKALSGDQTRTKVDGDRTVYTVDVDRRVGYVGGETGQRQGHPEARHVRLVVETGGGEDRFITAYPIRQR